jgi:2-polyprenyl-3-methyl-5-hydroxy-6-metoxy-1,4-benzoquinol methylase
MKDIKCIFCNVGSDHIVIDENGYKGRKCPQCGLIYVSPRPSFSQTINLYTNDKVSTYAESIIPNDYAKRLHAKYTLNIIKKYKKSGSILEIGAGAGYFLDEARKEGFEVYGIELNNILANFINNTFGIPCEETSLEKFSFGGKNFDLIYHCNALSHLYDPLVEFRRMNNKLSKNSLLVFETGNLGDVKERYYRTFTKFHYPDHLFFFSEDSLRHLLNMTGFEVIKIYRYSILPDYLKKKLILAIKYFSKSKKARKTEGKSNLPETLFQDDNRSGLRQLLKKSNIYLSFALLYNIGYIVSKQGQPQTLIIVAKKR